MQRFMEADGDNNICVGQVAAFDSYENTIYNVDGGLVAVLGVSDLVIARVGDVVMVAHKTKLERLKEFLATISEKEDLKKFL